MPDRNHDLRLTFGKAVGDYDKGRPGYPATAIDWILETAGTPSGGDVVDIGAGTGKFTAAFVGRGLRITAVEPDPIMRDRLTTNLPSVTALAGSAEAIPANDESFDLATLAQAWHWVDVPAASIDIARVLRPQGALALAWNIRDERVDWMAKFGEIIGASEAERYDSITPPVGDPLVRIDHSTFEWSNEVSREELMAMITSRSYIIAMDAGERSDVLARVDDLLASHPDLAGADTFVIPYVTQVTIVKKS